MKAVLCKQDDNLSFLNHDQSHVIMKSKEFDSPKSPDHAQADAKQEALQEKMKILPSYFNRKDYKKESLPQQ